MPKTPFTNVNEWLINVPWVLIISHGVLQSTGNAYCTIPQSTTVCVAVHNSQRSIECNGLVSTRPPSMRRQSICIQSQLHPHYQHPPYHPCFLFTNWLYEAHVYKVVTRLCETLCEEVLIIMDWSSFSKVYILAVSQWYGVMRILSVYKTWTCVCVCVCMCVCNLWTSHD